MSLSPLVKALLSIAIYLSIVNVLGFVLAKFAHPEQLEQDLSEDET